MYLLLCLCCLCTFVPISAIVSFAEGMQCPYEIREGIARTRNLQLIEYRLLKHAYDKNNYAVSPYSSLPLIPHIIHQIWIGGPLPNQFLHLTESWQKCHPDWQYILWDDAAIANYRFSSPRVHKIFSSVKNLGMKSDILRLDILLQIGGLYADIDTECLRSFIPLHHTTKFYAGSMGGSVIGIGILGSQPNHLLLSQALEKICRIKKASFTVGEIQRTTGPDFMTREILQYMKKTKAKEMCIYPRNFFYPMNSLLRHEYWNGRLSSEDKDLSSYSYSFATHHWASSWAHDHVLPNSTSQ